MTTPEFRDFDKAEFLYAPCMGCIKEVDGVLTADDFRFLAFPRRSGGIGCVTFGGNALTLSGFATAYFAHDDWPDIRRLLETQGERSFWMIRCSRRTAIIQHGDTEARRP